MITKTETPLFTPPLKFPGGKRHLVSKVREIIHRDHKNRARRLVDPFVGGMAIPLGLRPQRALLSDANLHVMNFYRWLKAGLRIERAMKNDSVAFYNARAEFNQLIKIEPWSKAAAELFYYLNRTCFNGLCRFNKAGEFNVPFGTYKTINYTTDFTSYGPVLSSWEFWVGDFSQIPVRPTDVIYADPPFDVEFVEYTPKGFSWNDQERLAVWLAQHPGLVIASNQATSRIIDLYRTLKFDIVTVEGPRRISCTGDRTPAVEILAVKKEENSDQT